MGRNILRTLSSKLDYFTINPDADKLIKWIPAYKISEQGIAYRNPGQFNDGVYDAILLYTIMNELVQDSHQLFEISVRGTFQFMELNGHVKENDLFGCLKYLEGMIKYEFEKKKLLKYFTELEDYNLYDELYGLIVKSQKPESDTPPA